MARKKTIICAALAAALLLTLAACGSAKNEGIAISGENITIGDLALRPDGEAGRLAENGGVKLLIPLEYDALLITETPKDSEDGTLFSVSEKASVDAAKEDGEEYDGAGWLFSIGRVDENGLEELRTWIDVGGAEPIAEDEEGNTYVFFHPTDVRLYRHSSEEMGEAMEMWGALNEWAASVKKSFLTENPQLKAFSGTAAEEGLVLENGGLRLTVPAETAPLLLTETPQDDKDGVLFTVCEQASVDAAKDNGENYDGAGWLFSIRTVDADTLHEMLCWDMSGAEVIAEDGNGTYYLFCHPTDVRFYRHSTEEMTADQEQWSALNEWAVSVKESFPAENGLTEVSFGNTDMDMAMARTMYDPDAVYTISTTQFGPLEPAGVDAAEYALRLLENVRYEYVDGAEAPDGEYVVLAFPEEDVRYDFYPTVDGQSWVRRVSGDWEELYLAVYEDAAYAPGEVMQAWYDAIAAANGKA